MNQRLLLHQVLFFYFIDFVVKKSQVLDRASSRLVSISTIDSLLLKFALDAFAKKYKGSVPTQPKQFAKLMRGIQALRYNLSGNSKYILNVECLVGDNDLNMLVTREDLEGLCAPLIAAIKETCATAMLTASESTILGTARKIFVCTLMICYLFSTQQLMIKSTWSCNRNFGY
jgi:hypothetical protein